MVLTSRLGRYLGKLIEVVSRVYFSRPSLQEFTFLISVIAFAYVFFLKVVDPRVTPELYRFSSQVFLFSALLVGAWKFLKEKDYVYVGIIAINVCFYFSFVIVNGGGLSTGGNNDVYNWGLSTNTVLGLANYENVMPAGEEIWKDLRSDAFGAYVFNGVWASILNRNVLYYATINIFTISLLTQVAIYRLLLSSGLSKTVSVIAAFFWIANPLTIYLNANYFLGQLLATLFLIISLSCYQNSYRSGESRLTGILCIVPSVFLIFVTYQSGFLALLLAFFICSYLLRLKKLSVKGENLPFNFSWLIYQIKIASNILIDIFIAASICFLLSFETSMHLMHRAGYVTQVVAGWSLPLMNPLTLMGLPSSARLENPANYLGYFSVGLLFVVLVGYRRIMSTNYLAIAFWLISALTLMYLLGMEFNKRDNNYQIWKAASFLILPLALIFIALVLNQIILNSEIPKFLAIVVALIICFHSFHYLSKIYFTSKQSVMDNFISLDSTIIYKTESRTKLILDTDAYRDTFIAFNVFSRNAEVYPLGQWYGPSVNLADVDLSSMYVITKDCNPGHVEQYRLYDGASLSPLFLEFRKDGCGLLGRILSNKGLSTGESNGWWSLGNRVSFDLNMDVFKVQYPGEIVFDLAPFLPPGVSSQKLLILNNGNLVGQYSIAGETQIKIPLERTAGLVKIEFLIEKTRRPMDYDLKSQDSREIALLFKSAGLYY